MTTLQNRRVPKKHENNDMQTMVKELAILIFYNKGGETLAQAAQRSSGGPIHRNIQGQVGRGSEQPDLVEDVPAHCRGVGLDDL